MPRILKAMLGLSTSGERFPGLADGRSALFDPVFFVAQKYFVQGIVMTGIKG